MKRVRVLLVDDHALVLAGIRLLAERIDGVEIVGEAHNGREAVQAALETRPDLVIMDISMEQLNGIDAASRIREGLATARVLILSSHTDEGSVRRALRAGVAGYLVKGSVPMELPMAISAVMRGQVYVSPEVAAHLVGPDGRPAQDDSSFDSLTPRHREVLQMIAEGKSTKEIAFILEVSIKTIETHRAAIMERLGIRDVPGLVRFALRHGLVAADPPVPEHR